jgi:ribosome-binding protein aMBF1 (putative translation factor)
VFETQRREVLLGAVQRAQADLWDDILFTDVLVGVCMELGLSDADVADKLPVSQSAVRRWRRGQNIPGPEMRKPVYRFLRSRLQQAIDGTWYEYL